MIRTTTLIALIVLALGQSARAQDDTPKTTPDGRFTIVEEARRAPVLSQGQTGTCWSFATVSFLESEIERIHGKHVDLSEIYPVYFTYLEKAKLYVEKKGKLEWGEGGLAHDLTLVIGKYGMAPQSAYSGLCEGEAMHNHAELARAVKGYLEAIVKAPRVSPKWEAGLRGILDAYLGAPPESFEFAGKTTTPAAFAKTVLGIDGETYVEVMSDAERGELWSRTVLDVPDNWWRYDGYLNVPVEDMLSAMDHALSSGYSVAVDVDVSEPGFPMGKGDVATLPDDLEKEGAITQAVRDEMFTSKATTDDHLMHAVGIARDRDGRTFYLVKNSWGDRWGPYGGYVFMSRPYMAAKMLSFMTHKDGLPEDFRKKLKL